MDGGNPLTSHPPSLPEAFVRRMRVQLGSEALPFFEALNKPYVRGLRMNPRKSLPCPVDIEGLLSPIPWEPLGCGLALESTAGTHPLHEAGAYYLQEPSAMVSARVLAPHPGEIVLDLCAAPGGKATQLADMLMGDGLLVCNEIVPSRARVLNRNMERMGIGNALVISSNPETLARSWPELFDAILVDAPCSGEGMFRRHPETRLRWNENTPLHCAQRQKRIVASAYALLKPGGRMVYSTCTFSREENEGLIDWLLRKYTNMEPMDFSIPIQGPQSLSSDKGTLRLYPHRLDGEGHFVALLRKKNGDRNEPSRKKMTSRLLPASVALKTPLKAALSAYVGFIAGRTLPQPSAMLGDALLACPPLPPLRGISILRAGLCLGTLRGRVFTPDHALAMGLSPPYPFLPVPLSLAHAIAYQRGESLPLQGGLKGYTLVTYMGLALGFAKGSDNQLKNHYPKGLRRP